MYNWRASLPAPTGGWARDSNCWTRTATPGFAILPVSVKAGTTLRRTGSLVASSAIAGSRYLGVRRRARPGPTSPAPMSSPSFRRARPNRTKSDAFGLFHWPCCYAWNTGSAMVRRSAVHRHQVEGLATFGGFVTDRVTLTAGAARRSGIDYWLCGLTGRPRSNTTTCSWHHISNLNSVFPGGLLHQPAPRASGDDVDSSRCA